MSAPKTPDSIRGRINLIQALHDGEWWTANRVAQYIERPLDSVRAVLNNMVSRRNARARGKSWAGREISEYTLKQFGMADFDKLYRVPGTIAVLQEQEG